MKSENYLRKKKKKKKKGGNMSRERESSFNTSTRNFCLSGQRIPGGESYIQRGIAHHIGTRMRKPIARLRRAERHRASRKSRLRGPGIKHRHKMRRFLGDGPTEAVRHQG